MEIARVAPVLPVSDIDEALARMGRMGFEVHAYEGDAPYGFATWGDHELHLAQVNGLDPKANTSAVYLFVDDAHAFHRAWAAADIGGRLHQPEPTPYGLLEGFYLDPDGNLFRFGSPLPDEKG